MFNFKVLSTVVAVTCVFSSTAFAFSDVEYQNSSSDMTMTVGSDELNPDDAFLHQVIPGDTQTIVIGEKTFMITDLHKVCAKVSRWPYGPTGWEMELRVNGDRVGVICAKKEAFEFIIMAHSTFKLKKVGGMHSVSYSDAGSMWVSGSYPASMKSASYSW